MYENDGELPPGWSMPPVLSDDDDEFDDDPRDSETLHEPPALNAEEPKETIFATPEEVQSALARARRALARSDEKLEEMPTKSKLIH